jgi:CelD/BcsL family acetyltransferase involved in cellulose biosynthesis
VLGPEWSGRLLHSLFAKPDDAPVRGVLATVRFGGRLAAAQLNLLAGETLHGWFVAYDPAFARGAPGLLLMEHVLATAPALGARRVCFGTGEAAYKDCYANRSLAVLDGFTAAASSLGRSRAAADAAWRLLEDERLGRVASLAVRTRRRLRQIASAELTLGGKAAGAAAALAALSKRPV